MSGIVRASDAQGALSNAVRRADERLAESSVRLATLRRIQRGADDPAGLLAAEQLHREITTSEEIAESAERQRTVAHVADSALAEVSSQLQSAQANLVTASSDATLSDGERAALQLEIDAALEAVDRIGATTSFAGRRLFAGDAELRVAADASGTRFTSESLPAVSTGALGESGGRLYELRSGGAASLESGDLERARNILTTAQSQVTTARARIGAFEHGAIDTTVRTVGDTLVQLQDARSRIEEADVAFESAQWVRSRIQADAALATLRLAQHDSQRVLQFIL